MNNQRIIFLLASMLFISSAHAHTGAGAVHSFTDGLLHPVQGIDHLLVMLAVGWWAAMLGGRALWLLPSSFLTMMAVGAGLHFAGFSMPTAEFWVAASVLFSGLLMMVAHQRVASGLAATLVGVFAICHGYVHAAELANNTQALSYVQGFLLTTATLHGLGLLVGLWGVAKSKAFAASFGLLCGVAGVVLLVNG